MPSRLLITGAAGFIGSHVVEALLRNGHAVIGVDNFDPFYDPAEKRANLAAAFRSPVFRLIEGDLTDADFLRGVLARDAFEVIVHLAAKAGVRPSMADPVGYVRANVLGTQVLLTAAHEHGVKRIVFASSSSVYGNASRVPFVEDDPAIQPVSPYAATKRAAELLCHTHQLLYRGSVLCLRLFTVYGPRQRPDLAIRKFSELMLAGRPIPLFGDGTTSRDYTWIDDIVAGILAAIDRSAREPEEFEVVNLGGHRATTLRRLVALLAEALGIEPSIEELPPQPGDVVRTYADLTRAKRLLGYAPKMRIEEGIPRFVDWIQTRRAGSARA